MTDHKYKCQEEDFFPLPPGFAFIDAALTQVDSQSFISIN